MWASAVSEIEFYALASAYFTDLSQFLLLFLMQDAFEEEQHVGGKRPIVKIVLII